MKQAIARLVDTGCIALAAVVSAHIAAVQGPENRPLQLLFAIVILLSSTALLPALGVYAVAPARALQRLYARLLPAWLALQFAGLLLLLSMHRQDTALLSWIAWWTGIGAVLIASWRLAASALHSSLRSFRLHVRNVVVVGHGEYLKQIVAKVDSSQQRNFRVAEVVELHGPDGRTGTDAGRHRDMELARLATLAGSGGVHEVWLALPLSAHAAAAHCIEVLKSTLVEIRLMPDFMPLGLYAGVASLDTLDIPSLSLSPSAISGEAMTGKEIFDRTFALAALIGLAPLFVVIAIAIKLSSPGPVFFRQRRKGLKGRPFWIYKFRSMRVHSEERGVVRQATRNDSRITPVGRFLRRTSLDELPQFINVLRGEMSIVGPRPHALEHDDLYEPLISGYLDRYRIKPGITGWAQINGFRGETDALEKMAGRVEYDLYYLRHRSFRMDIKIVLRTVVRGFFGKQAY
ncbi:undecaprenyl-phosphate glucose phosphotransferase [Paraburkholderia aromaticivorans]|uniref:Undecaprenyl-phosphate glucose phosphotransferase n=1 Tax=Paraburkholderia aromaticivorans TaxID=2026199 RepID=A0A248VQW7_9BURK|nr:undecaprenyl-phosphate glucose phosphotransferase [Paraburkholderia aromaticivorans]ASW01434.1 undecaprenyl-phosphate glucose phosphotransferase [Paraburkholderia aromaticivorans]